MGAHAVSAPVLDRDELSQRQSLEIAADLVDAVAHELARGGLCSVQLPQALALPLAEVLRGPLTVDFARILRREALENSPARELAYRVREAYFRLRSNGDAEVVDGTLLFVPSRETHIRQLLPVATKLEHVGTPAGWVSVREPHRLLLRRSGQTVWDASETIWSLRARVRLFAELRATWSALQDVISRFPISARSAELILTRTLSVFERSVGMVARLALRMQTLLISAKLPLVIVGNPAVLEGRTACYVAAWHGIGTAAVQHGRFDASDPVLRGASVDLFCAWGEDTARVAEESGFAARAIWTGAPWHPPGNSVKPQRGRILVALSGPGHGISMREHTAVLDALRRCMSLLPATEWTFRIHPKDCPKPYERIARLAPSRCELQLARMGPPIEEALLNAKVLFTVGSASALDAMRLGVPVVTLARPPGEPEPDYVQARATTHVQHVDGLAEAFAVLLSSGPAKPIEDACRRYVEGLYGPADGLAPERIMAALTAGYEEGRAHADT